MDEVKQTKIVNKFIRKFDALKTDMRKAGAGNQYAAQRVRVALLQFERDSFAFRHETFKFMRDRKRKA